MRRGGGTGGDNPRGKNNISFIAPMPKFLMKLKEEAQSDGQKQIKEWEDRLAKAELEGDDHSGALVVDSDETLENGKHNKNDTEEQRVDMDTFKPKFLSKKHRISSQLANNDGDSGMAALKNEIEARKKQDIATKKAQLAQIEKDEQNSSKSKGNSDKDDSNNSSSSVINAKRKSIGDALKQLEKEATKQKQVKKSLLSFNEDDEDY